MKEKKLLDVRPLEDYVDGIIDDFKAQGLTPKLKISSLPEFSSRLWGLKEGELMIVGARTSQGKSSFVAQMAWDISDLGEPVLFLSLEMGVPDIMLRLFCNVCKVDNIDIQTGKYNLNKELREKFDMFKQMLVARKLMITCGIGDTFSEVIHMVETMEPTPKLVVVDYIQAIRTTAGSSREQTDEYIRLFRQLALEKKFCGILVSQINRGAAEHQGRKPQLHQLKSTGVLEEHADRVLLLHWGWHENKTLAMNEFHVNIAKNRSGATGEFNLDFNPRFYRFEEEVYRTVMYK